MPHKSERFYWRDFGPLLHPKLVTGVLRNGWTVAVVPHALKKCAMQRQKLAWMIALAASGVAGAAAKLTKNSNPEHMATVQPDFDPPTSAPVAYSPPDHLKWLSMMKLASSTLILRSK